MTATLDRLRKHAVDVRPLQVVAYRRLLLGQGTSFVGSVVTQVAVPVEIYAITKDSFYVGLVGLFGLVPIVLFGLYGGAIADTVDRRKLMMIMSVIVWIMTIGLFLQTIAGLENVWLILVLVMVQAGAWAVASAARGAIIPRLVPEELVPAANTLNFTVGNVGQAAGPLLAGVLVDLNHGFAIAYGFDAVLFTVMLYATWRLPSIPPDGKKERASMRMVGQGLKFIASNPVLVMSFLVDIAAMVLAMPKALFPQVADEHYGGNVGWLYAAIPIGAVLFGAMSGWIGRVSRQGVALVIAIVLWGAAVAGSGLVHSLWLVVLLLAVAGGADLVSAVYRQTILQTYAPDELRGRMQGVFVAVVAGGPRLGDLRSGWTASATSAQFSWVGGGLACMVVVAVAGFLVRPFWRYRVTAAEPSDQSGSQASVASQ